MNRTVALGAPTVGQEELDAIREVFESGWLSGAGPSCLAFEARVRRGRRRRRTSSPRATAARHCTSPSSCSASGPGDEVIVGDYTFPATGHSVHVGRCHARLRRRPPRHLVGRPRSSRGGDHAAHGRHHRRRRLRAARRLRRAPRDRRPPRPLAHRGCRVLGRRDLQGPPGREPRRRRRVQLPRPQGHHGRRGRRARQRRRRPRRPRAQAPHLRHRAGDHPRGHGRPARARRSTSSATTTASPTSRRRSCASRSSGFPTCSPPAQRVADGVRGAARRSRAAHAAGGPRRPHPPVAVATSSPSGPSSTGAPWRSPA